MLEAFSVIKKTFSWDHLDMQSLLHYYRYASLLITSLFYLSGQPYASLYLKIGVVVFLALEAWLFIRVFSETKSTFTKKALILIELAGLLIIVFFTGGLDSAYLWYAINPILLSSTLVPLYFCWASVVAFIASAFYLRSYIAVYSGFSNQQIWSERAYIALIFILVTLSAQLSSHLVSRLSWQKAVMEKQIDHIKALYEAAEVFSYLSDPQEVANLFSTYCKALTDATKTIVWVREQGTKSKLNKVIYAVKGPKSVLLEQNWYPYIKDLFEDEGNGWKTDYKLFPSNRKKRSGLLITVRIKSSTNLFGVLSAYYSDEGIISRKDTERTLVFLADLCAASLEKRYLEAMAEKLILAEEKDRIARQIHDTVNQNLFGLIHGLNNIKKQEHLPFLITEQLALLQKTAHSCLQELRHSIYNLCEDRPNKKSFADDLKAFIADLQKLNNIKVSFKSDGDFEKIGSHACNSLFRIIREASSNAIRHGACKKIVIDLQVSKEGIMLFIKDDGCGFDEQKLVKNRTKGLGLLSMKELATGIGGDFKIESNPGLGTVVTCAAGWPVQASQTDRKEAVTY